MGGFDDTTLWRPDLNPFSKTNKDEVLLPGYCSNNYMFMDKTYETIEYRNLSDCYSDIHILKCKHLGKIKPSKIMLRIAGPNAKLRCATRDYYYFNFIQV